MNWLVAIVTAIATWFGEALWKRAEKPTTGAVVDPTDEDLRAHEALLAKLRRWKAGLIVALCLAMSGCFDSRVYFPRPAVPVRLGEDVHSVRVFIKVGDAWQEAKANLFAGQTIMTDPEDFPLPEVLRGQGIKPVP